MVHPDLLIRLYVSDFPNSSTTIVIYSHLSEYTVCVSLFPAFNTGQEWYAKVFLSFRETLCGCKDMKKTPNDQIIFQHLQKKIKKHRLLSSRC